MLEALGEPITLGSTTVLGIVDATDAVVGRDGQYPEQVAGSLIVHVITGSLPGLEGGAVVTFRGQSYTVREQLQIEDGALTRLDLVVTA